MPFYSHQYSSRLSIYGRKYIFSVSLLFIFLIFPSKKSQANLRNDALRDCHKLDELPREEWIVMLIRVDHLDLALVSIVDDKGMQQIVFVHVVHLHFCLEKQ